ncbi:hypothetical protein [Mycolicibacterium fortuitum]|uniref:Uncharacterized protein n=1 Tax=Mycolicibacterium fortuitum TaxID=1766 RepID=A0AAE4VDT8_MYCFO|nr:hypothetical protein [Mycolicibacterium fortuitum]MDV7193306.1 hypothetical protein [Mycolicibacterium fortuitum]MDV7206013.1 hypothetical protein [Mycolicibacterium fortuitum]MDV7227426.1 hypothetical protein [Mycolicibacterium fortuitum]MDV7259877.1 hypothetical protein [Mycolicibacterium fortuitum]MDV7286026.1 hypothetical protein [Mycolicibacterium fortuitum]
MIAGNEADSAAQAEYDRSPELRELLTRAADAPTVRRTYTPIAAGLDEH